MLLIRTYDHNYILPIYAHYKLGQLFDIYINDQKVEVVSEDESLLNYKNGTVHFVLIESKTKKRKLPNTGFWKQNGVESIVDVSLPESYQGSKRTFTYQDDKKFKCWEYVLLLFFSHYGYNVLIRHYLKDNSSSVTRYTSGNVKISIRANDRNPFFSKNDFLIDHNDYEIIDSIFNFININKFNIQDINKYIHNNNNSSISPTTTTSILNINNNNNNNNNFYNNYNINSNNNNNTSPNISIPVKNNMNAFNTSFFNINKNDSIINNNNNIFKNNNNNNNNISIMSNINLNNSTSTSTNLKLNKETIYADENERISSEDEDGANLSKHSGSSASGSGYGGGSNGFSLGSSGNSIDHKGNQLISSNGSYDGSSNGNIINYSSMVSNSFEKTDNNQNKKIKLI